MNLDNEKGLKDAPWLSDVFSHSPDIIVILDRDGIVRNANEAFLSFCCRTAVDLIGKKISEFIPADRRIQWTHDLNKLIIGDWTSMDGTLINGRGRLVPFHIILIAQSTDAGRPVAILHLQDASVYQTVERALVASQGQWEKSFDAISDYMGLLDRSGNILRANQAMTRRFKPIYGNLIGLDYRAIFNPSAPDEGAALPHAVEAAPYVIPEIKFKNLDGWFTVSSFPLKDDLQSAIGAILIVRDVTEQHNTTEALKKAETSQHQSSKMEAIGRLAGGIAHDFNNMLTAIMGYSSLMLKMTQPDDPRCKDIQEIILTAERATALTRQLLDFSRDQALETKNVNLNAIVQNMEQFLNRTLGEKIKLSLRLDSGLQSVMADVSRLEQVVINLVVNARDAMPNGGQLMIETGNRSLDHSYCASHPNLAPGHYVVMEVSDTGCGMSPHVLEHLFEPFFTTKTKGKGTGLGLMTTYGIVKQLGGRITVYSEVGRGTTFKIYFPKSAKEMDADTAPTHESILMRGSETIMVVDDEINIVTMASRILTELGYQVIIATSGREALKLSDQQSDKIDMILADIVMPEINGTDLVRLLRKKRPNLKALYMSGYATNAAIKIGKLKPDTAFLRKPFNPETLTHCIRKVLETPGTQGIISI